jgi:PAS domain S-box-containing protein
MRLRRQFLISLFIFALVVALLVSYIFVTDSRIAELHHEQEIVREIETVTSKLDSTSLDFFFYEHNVTEWETAVSVIYVDVSCLHADAPQQQKLIESIFVDLKKANDTFNKTALTLEGTPINRSDLANPMFEDVLSNTSHRVEQLAVDTHQLAGWLDQQENAMNQTNFILIVTLTVLFGSYFVLMYHLFFKHALHPLAALHTKTQEIIGDLGVSSAGTHRRDEISELHSDFDGLMGSLKQTSDAKEALEKEISERKKVEQALIETQAKLKRYTSDLEKIVDERTKKIRESEQSYRELYDSFGEAFIATDWELTVIHCNKAAERVTKVAAKDALGKKIYDVFPEMASVDVTPYFELLRHRQAARFMMNTVSRETSSPAIFEISTYPATQGIIILVEDKTEEEYTKRLSAIGQTAGMVGHDIRNPLQAITSDVYLIREELSSIPNCGEIDGVNESLSTIEGNIFYINKIVSDLQDYTRPLAPVCKATNIAELMHYTLKTTNIPQNIEAKVEAPPDLTINTDPNYLMRVLSNLMINAVQAMPHGGKLYLNASKTGHRVAITVQDTGVGMPREIQEKIFTPLFTTKAKGQGLGLAVVKRLVEGLAGTITFESVMGKGTVFHIELPLE